MKKRPLLSLLFFQHYQSLRMPNLLKTPSIFLLSLTVALATSPQDARANASVENKTTESSYSAANQKKIKGVIKDTKGQPIIGANISVKGTTNGTITDLDGLFVIDVPTGSILKISYIGYESKEILVGAETNLTIELKENALSLDEVVVVGYGVQKKSDVTGSISVTKGDDMLKQQSFSALDGLRGKSAGVNIFSNSGQPGGASRVIIRGISTIKSSSDPLYIVDGVAMEDFKFLNPNDIERIEVLKDASSAAIYGARGANGVIMVTTKRGNKEDGAKISYAGSVSVGTMAKYLDVMDSYEFVDALKQSYENGKKYYGLTKTLDLSDPNFFNPDGSPKYNTDWQRESTRTTVSQNHQLNIQQGGKNSSTGVFLNYTDQQGLLLNTYMKRINAKMAYDAKPTKWLSTGINLLVNHTWANEAEEGGGSQVPRRTMLEMIPFMPVKMPNGGWTNSTSLNNDLGFEGMANPVHVLTTQQRMRYKTQIFGNAALTFHLLPNLDLKTQLGIDAHNNRNRDYSPKDLINLSFPGGKAVIDHTDMLYWQEETYLTYNENIGKHRFGAMVGMSWQERVVRSSSSAVEKFSDDFFDTDNMGAGTLPLPPTSLYSREAMNSYFLRGTYAYNDKYLATVTSRVDGSSKFGKNNKYAFFPSVGLGWIISNEEFMSGMTAIDQLKLHSSFGVTGNSGIMPYSSLATISSGSVLINGERTPSSYASRLPNPDLKWEKTNQFDFGFNLNLFNNRLNFDISYYYKRTTDLLLDKPVPHSTGYKSVVDNIGEVSNQGLDFMINSVNIDSRDFSWSTTLNLNYNKNRIEALGKNNEDIEPGPWWVSGSQIRLRVGESLGSFYGYERLGIWTEAEAAEAKAAGQNVGQAKRSKDKKILGKGLPDFTGSIINNLRYKNFDLTFDLQFVLGVDVLQQFMHSTEDRFGYSNGLASVYRDAYSPSNPNTMVQAIRNAPLTGQSSELDSHWVADGSYLRANLIQLGYTFDAKAVKALGLSSLRAYVSVNNAFLIHSKDFKGYDPEGSSWNDNQWGQNMFFFQYPKPRTFNLGVNVTF